MMGGELWIIVLCVLIITHQPLLDLVGIPCETLGVDLMILGMPHVGFKSDFEDNIMKCLNTYIGLFAKIFNL